MGKLVLTLEADSRNHLIRFTSRLYAMYGFFLYLSRTSEWLNVRNNAITTRGGGGYFADAVSCSNLLMLLPLLLLLLLLLL